MAKLQNAHHIFICCVCFMKTCNAMVGYIKTPNSYLSFGSGFEPQNLTVYQQ